jgi:ubiquinone/menaquinone biosynthesis C-methylase UbiE
VSDSKSVKASATAHPSPVCPWWLCFTFDNVFRRLLQNPERILKPFIKPGWTVLDVGPGLGYFTIPLAKLVGDRGKVIAADLQKKMLEGIAQRALRAGVQERIKLQQSAPESLGISDSVDFCLAFWMVHEVPDRARFLAEIAQRLKPQGLFLLVEPRFHVSAGNFDETRQFAGNVGLIVSAQPSIFLSYAVLLKKESQTPNAEPLNL